MPKVATFSSSPRRGSVVVLSASNGSRGLPALVATVRSLWHYPVELLIAKGHGRSYGSPSRAFWSNRPPMLGGGLLERLDALPARPTWALLTDIGNDIMYGADAPTIAQWVGHAADQLAQRSARLCISLLPRASIAALSPQRYLQLRNLLFPRCTLSWDDVQQLVADLNQRLTNLAQVINAHTVEPPASWYGSDPIHHRPAMQTQAWRTMLAPLAPRPEARPGLLRLALAQRYRFLIGRSFHLHGREYGREQPAHVCADGTRIWLY